MTRKEFKEYLEVEVYKNCNCGDIKEIIKRLIAVHISPSTNAVYLIRKMQMLYNSNNKLNRFRSLLIHAKLAKRYGVHVDPNAQIGLGLRLPHPTSIVIGTKVVIGKNCTLYQNTTIGGSRIGDALKGNQPIIGDNCILFAGSMILGKVKVGNNCIIGANSLLLSDAEDDSIYVGSPAKKVRK